MGSYRCACRLGYMLVGRHMCNGEPQTGDSRRVVAANSRRRNTKDAFVSVSRSSPFAHFKNMYIYLSVILAVVLSR